MEEMRRVDEWRSGWEIYEREDGKRVILRETNSVKQWWYVTVIVPGKTARTVASRCSHGQALRIAREEYHKR